MGVTNLEQLLKNNNFIVLLKYQLSNKVIKITLQMKNYYICIKVK